MPDPIITAVDKDQGYIGFANFHMAALEENSTSAYEVGEVIELPYVQTLDPPSTAGEGTQIFADDSVYIAGVPQTDRSRVVTVAQLDLPRLATLAGGEMQMDGSMKLSYANPQKVPAYACSWSHMLSNNGGYQGVKMYAATIGQLVETQITTNDGTVKVAAWNVTLNFAGRAFDMYAEERKNFTDYPALIAWLKDFPSMPTSGF